MTSVKQIWESIEQQQPYSPEEVYFYQVNRELMEQERQRLDSKREKKRLSDQKKEHWMRCPKCGHALAETKLSGILVEQCTQCQGVFFDSDELSLLLEAQESHVFVNLLKKLFVPMDVPRDIF